MIPTACSSIPNVDSGASTQMNTYRNSINNQFEMVSCPPFEAFESKIPLKIQNKNDKDKPS